MHSTQEGVCPGKLNSFRVLRAGDVLAETPGRHPDALWLALGTQGGDTMSEGHALSGSMRCPGSVAALPCEVSVLPHTFRDVWRLLQFAR